MEERLSIPEQLKIFEDREKDKSNWIYPPKVSKVTDEEDTDNGIS